MSLLVGHLIASLRISSDGLKVSEEALVFEETAVVLELRAQVSLLLLRWLESSFSSLSEETEEVHL